MATIIIACVLGAAIHTLAVLHRKLRRHDQAIKQLRTDVTAQKAATITGRTTGAPARPTTLPKAARHKRHLARYSGGGVASPGNRIRDTRRGHRVATLSIATIAVTIAAAAIGLVADRPPLTPPAGQPPASAPVFEHDVPEPAPATTPPVAETGPTSDDVLVAATRAQLFPSSGARGETPSPTDPGTASARPTTTAPQPSSDPTTPRLTALPASTPGTRTPTPTPTPTRTPTRTPTPPPPSPTPPPPSPTPSSAPSPSSGGLCIDLRPVIDVCLLGTS